MGAEPAAAAARGMVAGGEEDVGAGHAYRGGPQVCFVSVCGLLFVPGPQCVLFPFPYFGKWKSVTSFYSPEWIRSSRGVQRTIHSGCPSTNCVG